MRGGQALSGAEREDKAPPQFTCKAGRKHRTVQKSRQEAMLPACFCFCGLLAGINRAVAAALPGILQAQPDLP